MKTTTKRTSGHRPGSTPTARTHAPTDEHGRPAVIITLPPAVLRAYGDYARFYSLKLEILLQAEAWNETLCIADTGLISHMERRLESGKTPAETPVTLHFCPGFTAVISRLAEILRMSAEEYLRGLFTDGVSAFSFSWKEACGHDSPYCTDAIYAAVKAHEVEQLSLADHLPSNHTGKDVWECLGIKNPAAEPQHRRDAA